MSLLRLVWEKWGICKHSLQPNTTWFFGRLERAYLGPTEPDWLLLGSLHCVESPMEVTQEGSLLEVRGQIKAEHYWQNVLTHMSSVPTIWHGFISPLLCLNSSNDWCQSNSVDEMRFDLSNRGNEGKRGHLEDAVRSQMYLLGCRSSHLC